jgi:hypothetical protein
LEVEKLEKFLKNLINAKRQLVSSDGSDGTDLEMNPPSTKQMETHSVSDDAGFEHCSMQQCNQPTKEARGPPASHLIACIPSKGGGSEGFGFRTERARKQLGSVIRSILDSNSSCCPF